MVLQRGILLYCREKGLFSGPNGGHPEESLKVLERLFILMPKTPGVESTQIYTEARNLYSEIKAETESKTSTH
jgi:hypothetical protein